MELPGSIKAIGDQLANGGDIAPEPELFDAYDVFAAEVAQIFTRPWLAVDHASRLAADGDFVRADAGPRSIVVVRESEGRIHALRNACLHAGYRVCEEESGRADHLFCIYHGWSYALDGRLTDPYLRPDIQDRSRFRLPHYAMQIQRGLIFVDPSAVTPEAPAAADIAPDALPPELGEHTVARRERHKVGCNWKRLRQFLWANPELALAGGDNFVACGPLSFVALGDGEAALVRLVPRYPGNTEVEVVQMARPGAARPAAAVDPLGDTLRDNADNLAAAPLGRGFFEWYWPLIEPVTAE